MRWPDPWPADYLTAMRATTYAFAAGRGREFAMQAYRDAFQRGSDLSIAGNVLASAAARRPGPGRDSRRPPTTPRSSSALRAATDAAYDLGVFGVPTIAIGAGPVLGR